VPLNNLVLDDFFFLGSDAVEAGALDAEEDGFEGFLEEEGLGLDDFFFWVGLDLRLIIGKSSSSSSSHDALVPCSPAG
jgi:hypothetical protein